MLSSVTKIESWLSQAFECSCGKRHEVPIRHVRIESGALSALPEYCAAAGIARAAVVCDARAQAAAGDEIRRHLTAAGMDARVIVLRDTREGEVVADEAAIVALLTQLPPETEALIAAGSGTVHDIVRFACHAGRRRFLSAPTAPSVDGFASAGAPLVIGGFKNTVPAMAPEAIFADLDVLCRAPQAMIAAGFGDMLGKFTSLADWHMGRLLLDEHHCSLSAEMTRQALGLCIERLDDIAKAKPEGIRALMEALILSGISMLLVGHSRPASGAEHHLSHFWEMRYLQKGRKALLHGAKVGAATVLISGLYKELARLLREEGAARLAERLRLEPERDMEAIRRAYGPIAEQVLAENGLPAPAPAPAPTPDAAGAPASSARRGEDRAVAANAMRERLLRHAAELLAVAESLPGPDQMAGWLTAAGGAAAPGELGVSKRLVEESLQAAHYVRSRMTVLRFFHFMGMGGVRDVSEGLYSPND